MEPLSVSTIAELVLLGSKAAVGLAEYIVELKHAPKVMESMQEELQAVNSLLHQMQSWLKHSGRSNRLSRHSAQDIMAATTACQKTFDDLMSLLQENRHGLKTRIQWVWNEKGFTELLRRLESHKTTLGLVMALMNTKSSARMEAQLGVLADQQTRQVEVIARMAKSQQKASRKARLERVNSNATLHRESSLARSDSNKRNRSDHLAPELMFAPRLSLGESQNRPESIRSLSTISGITDMDLDRCMRPASVLSFSTTTTLTVDDAASTFSAPPAAFDVGSGSSKPTEKQRLLSARLETTLPDLLTSRSHPPYDLLSFSEFVARKGHNVNYIHFCSDFSKHLSQWQVFLDGEAYLSRALPGELADNARCLIHWSRFTSLDAVSANVTLLDLNSSARQIMTKYIYSGSKQELELHGKEWIIDTVQRNGDIYLVEWVGNALMYVLERVLKDDFDLFMRRLDGSLGLKSRSTAFLKTLFPGRMNDKMDLADRAKEEHAHSRVHEFAT